MGSGHVVGSTIDYVVIIGYFVAILSFGSFFGRHSRTTKDFFFGGQRFSWWLVGFSLVATTVGSYSFVKYSAVAYKYGLSSTHSYLNDWFWMPLVMFGWIPIVYYSKVTSVPEYFERRFDRRTRLMTTLVLLLYLVGYVGINFYTLGVALHALLGWDVMLASFIVAVISAIYVTAGGQTAVIMTDVVQGVILLVAGLLLLYLGWSYLGGPAEFWSDLPYRHRLPLAYFNNPPEFNFVGILGQDGLAQSMSVYFMNQGMIMRFLSAKSVQEGRKALVLVLVFLQVLAAVAVAGAGWIGKAMVNQGLLPGDSNAKTVFVLVANMLCQPGVFGLMMAALTAALMSTADTLINAISAVTVNDVYRPYFRAKAADAHFLRVARIVSLAAAAVGLMLVPVFASFDSIYAAHGAFTAAVGPPMGVILLLGVFWKRFTKQAAFYTLIVGAAALALSMVYPDVLQPFAFGTDRGSAGPMKTWFYARAFYGIVVCSTFAVLFALLTKPEPAERIRGLVWGTIRDAEAQFKGGEANMEPGKPVRLASRVLEPEQSQQVNERWEVQLPQWAHKDLAARPGDLIHVSDKRWWLGGLRSAQAVLSAEHDAEGMVGLPPEFVEASGLRAGEIVKVEKIL